jgi:hypothetical protein
VIHHLDLHSCGALKLRAGGIHDLLRPSQRPGSRSHLLDDLLAVFFVALGRVDAPGRHRVKGCVHRLARLIRKSGNDIELKLRGIAELSCITRLLLLRIDFFDIPPDRAVAFAGVLFERRAIDDLDLRPTCTPPTTVS